MRAPALRSLIVLLAAVLAALGTARLGFWQLDRAAQKTALFEARQQRGAMPVLAPSQLPRMVADLPVALHRRVQLEGRWLSEHTVFLENRQMNGVPGFYVVTPLRLAEGDVQLVQRGWLPRDARDLRRLAPFDTPVGTVSVEGRIAPGFARLFEFGDAASGAIRQNLDIDAFAKQTSLPLLPAVVVQSGDVAKRADGLRRDWSPATLDVSKHYGYALQWFALSALITGLYVWFQLLRPRFADAARDA